MTRGPQSKIEPAKYLRLKRAQWGLKGFTKKSEPRLVDKKNRVARPSALTEDLNNFFH